MSEENIYQQNHYLDREDYLNQMAEHYGVDVETTFMLADLLGEEEDFDGLISALQDI